MMRPTRLPPRPRHLGVLLALVAACAGTALTACGGSGDDPGPGTIPFTPDRPALGPPHSAPGDGYTGSDTYVREAQARYVTGYDLHRKFVMRTCGPTNGVCHNQKEYPDLHTEGTFLAALGAPCNVQPGSWEAVFDRCERRGDRVRFAETQDLELGWVDLVPGAFVDYQPDGEHPTQASPGLHVRLHDPLPGTQAQLSGTAQLVRSFVDRNGNVQDLVFASYTSQWWVLGDRRHLFAEVRESQQEAVERLLRSGVVQGDHNRNGVFGMREGLTVPLLNPGKPEESYLVARMRGHMQGTPVPGSRMPLANVPPSVVDMLALMCWLQGLDPAAAQFSLAAPIDYTACKYSDDPAALDVVGQGVGFRARILPMLQARCGGCHGGAQPQAGFDVMNDDPATQDKDAAEDIHARLLRPSTQQPTLKLVDPVLPVEQGYLYRKLTGDGSITGQRMPLDPLNQNTALPPEELDELIQWLRAGALLN